MLEIGGRYFAVDSGVWFVASNPKGPWAVADTVPESEIQKIPPSSSAYNTTYVHVYQSTPEVVYVGYTPGYMWSFPYYGVPVYGTGWYYPPYPAYYYPRPYTYGFHVGYNPWTGWNFGVSWGMGFMHVGMGWGGGYYGPWRGYYGGGRYGCCGGGWYGGYRPGWGGSYHYSSHTNVNIGNSVNYGNQRRVGNELQRNPNAGRLRNENLYNQPATRARNADRATVQRNVQQARPVRGANNNVLADRDGSVVRKSPEGLQTRDRNKWEGIDSPAARDRAKSIDRSGVQRDYQARQRGAERERSARQVPRTQSQPQRAQSPPSKRTQSQASKGSTRRR